MCRTINQIIVVNVYHADKCHLLSCFEDIVEVIVTHLMQRLVILQQNFRIKINKNIPW